YAFKDRANNISFSLPAGNPASPGDIQAVLARSPEYKLAYADRIQKNLFNNGPLSPASVIATYQARMNEVDEAIVAETARWGDNRVTADYTLASWMATQNGLINTYFPTRGNDVLGYARAAGLYPSTTPSSTPVGPNAPSFSLAAGTYAT